MATQAGESQTKCGGQALDGNPVVRQRVGWIWVVCRLTELYDARPDETQRSATRFPLQGCTAELDSPHDGWSDPDAELVDVSSNGVGFITAREPVVGSAVCMCFPDGSPSVCWHFIVRWTKPLPDGRFRCGGLLTSAA